MLWKEVVLCYFKTYAPNESLKTKVRFFRLGYNPI